MRTRWVTSLPPTTMTATSGDVPPRQPPELGAQHRRLRADLGGHVEPDRAPRLAATRFASWAPSVRFGFSAPSPAAIESPSSSRSTTSRVAVLVGPTPCRPRARPRRAACRCGAARRAWRRSTSRPPSPASSPVRPWRARSPPARGRSAPMATRGRAAPPTPTRAPPAGTAPAPRPRPSTPRRARRRHRACSGRRRAGVPHQAARPPRVELGELGPLRQVQHQVGTGERGLDRGDVGQVGATARALRRPRGRGRARRHRGGGASSATSSAGESRTSSEQRLEGRAQHGDPSTADAAAEVDGRGRTRWRARRLIVVDVLEQPGRRSRPELGGAGAQKARTSLGRQPPPKPMPASRNGDRCGCRRRGCRPAPTTSAPAASLISAIALTKEIFVARKVFAAVFASSAVARSVTCTGTPGGDRRRVDLRSARSAVAVGDAEDEPVGAQGVLHRVALAQELRVPRQRSRRARGAIRSISRALRLPRSPPGLSTSRRPAVASQVLGQAATTERSAPRSAAPPVRALWGARRRRSARRRMRPPRPGRW